MRWTVAICALIGLGALQDASPQMHKQGNIQFYNGAAVDIDEGTSVVLVYVDGNDFDPIPTHPSAKGTDFWFEVGRRFQQFHPQHGAKFATSSVHSSEYDDCTKATYKKGSVRVDNLPASEYLCVRTSEGRYANIQIVNYDSKLGRLSLKYTVWEKQAPPIAGKTNH